MFQQRWIHGVRCSVHVPGPAQEVEVQLLPQEQQGHQGLKSFIASALISCVNPFHIEIKYYYFIWGGGGGHFDPICFSLLIETLVNFLFRNFLFELQKKFFFS